MPALTYCDDTIEPFKDRSVKKCYYIHYVWLPSYLAGRMKSIPSKSRPHSSNTSLKLK
uniref:Uncharacterized protein n=1 Tax=Rhizophagus irregularis (strain DAOM 181602 / DAOM 197198 / MUCL 43194) TaxID=747089 RepID=U9TZF9_RHIID